MAETNKPGHVDVAMVEVPAQLIAALYQAVDHAASESSPGAGIEVESSAQAIALLYQLAARSDGLSLQNAAQDRQVLNQISTAVVSKAIALVMAIGDQGQMTSLVAAGPVVPEGLAVLMGNLFEATKPSTGAEFADALSQQQNTDAQETTTEGVLEIYSLDTTAAAGATEKAAQTGAAARQQRLHDDTD